MIHSRPIYRRRLTCGDLREIYLRSFDTFVLPTHGVLLTAMKAYHQDRMQDVFHSEHDPLSDPLMRIYWAFPSAKFGCLTMAVSGIDGSHTECASGIRRHSKNFQVEISTWSRFETFENSKNFLNFTDFNEFSTTILDNSKKGTQIKTLVSSRSKAHLYSWEWTENVEENAKLRLFSYREMIMKIRRSFFRGKWLLELVA